METLYTYDDLTRMTGILKDAIRRRIKRIERTTGVSMGRTEITNSGVLMTFTTQEVDTFLQAVVEMQEVDPSVLEDFRSPKPVAMVAAPSRQGGGALTLEAISTGAVAAAALPAMDELAVSRALSEVAEKRLPLRPSSIGILIALFENRSKPYTPDTIRQWCKGRGHSFERVGFKFTWSEGAVIVSVPLL